MKNIKVKNAYLNNLKNIDLTIPKDKFVVVTGVSGSGKSSMVFDIIFQTGRKGYLQSIGILPMIDEKEYYDTIEGIGPTVAVKQSIIKESNPRSIVGTKTKIYDYLRLFYSLEGIIECSICGSKTNENLVCESCGNVEEKLHPPVFSFNTPRGMCLRCRGRGYVSQVDVNKILDNKDLSLREICKKLNITSSRIKKELRELPDSFNFDINTPFKNLDEEVKDIFLYGGEFGDCGDFWGVVNYFHWKAAKGRVSPGIIKRKTCPKCNGYKVGDEARRVTVMDKHIAQVGNMTIKNLKNFLSKLHNQSLSNYGKNILNIISNQIQDIIDVGLSHLTLYRPMPTLSGGEIQRLFLASHLDCEMESLTYIFDEPTMGLHELEKKKLLSKIEKLKNLGNSVIIVEHDKNTIKKSDYIIDFGPLAGELGGEVIYEGDYKGLLSCDKSITGQFLSGKINIPYKNKYKNITNLTPKLFMENISTNNLKNISVEIPLGMLVGISGVSGSGKSSLISHTLIPKLKSYFKYGKYSNIKGMENVADYKEMSQDPIGRNRRSIPMTYLNIWDEIRNIFSNLPISKKSNYTLGNFSFNSTGACPVCQGIGYMEENLGEFGKVSYICSECEGKRYNIDILKVKYKDKNIADILDMSVSEGTIFFKNHENIYNMLSTLEKVGMGYIKLGQPTPTLSGGEAQRIKLAKDIGNKKSCKDKLNTLYILDEPTTGLSFYDTSKLLSLLDQLIKDNNSIIVIEHDPDVLSFCDWIIELGPNGGNEGGQVIAEGSPLDLKNNKNSKIGEFLKVVD
ncbi:hypothetical protein [Dethiothermospora halolimnae]|uniref:hypothetical protein n=1 Tax=Dethiothermospora halolimnae TaxID=3114390 RepID=UPI003CCBCE7D